MKNSVIYARLLLGGIALSVLPLNAQTTLWDDSFDAASIDSNWSLVAAGTDAVAPSQAGGNITFDAGVGSQFNRSYIGGNTSQSGGTAFLGNPIYNFFEHDLQIVISGLSMPGTPTAGSSNFFLEIASSASLGDAYPRSTAQGAFLRILKSTAGAYSLILVDKGASTSTPIFASMSGLPTAITLDLNATGVTASISGATFNTGDSNSRSATWSNISSTTFSGPDPVFLSFGAQNFDNVENSDTTMAISGLTVSAISDAQTTLWDDAFDAASIDSNWSLVDEGTDAVAPSQAGGNITFDAGVGSQFNRSYMGGNTSQSGGTAFLGNPIYNFFEHDLQIVISGLSMPGTPTVGTSNFFLEIASSASLGDAYPRSTARGAFLRMEKSTTGAYRMIFIDKGAASSTPIFASMSGLPTAITLDLNATGVTASISGATFNTGDSNFRTATWSNISSTTFSGPDPVFLSFGAQNFDNVENSDTTMSISGLTVSAFSDLSPLALSGFAYDPGTNTFDVSLKGAASTAYILVEAADLDFGTPDQSPIPLAGATASVGTIVDDTIVTDANGDATVEGVSLGAPAKPATFIRAQSAP